MPRGKTTSPALHARHGQIHGLRAADKQFIWREATNPRFQFLGGSTHLEGDCKIRRDTWTLLLLSVSLAVSLAKFVVSGKLLKRNGAPGVIRTPDLLVRSQLLYPAELRAHAAASIAIIPSRAQREQEILEGRTCWGSRPSGRR